MFIKVSSTKQTKDFYNNLMTGNISRNLLGTSKRFNAGQIARSTNVQKYFVELVEPYISAEDHILDLGCGTGGFSFLLSKMCSQLVAVDIVEEFVIATEELLNSNKLQNTTVLLQDGDSIPAVNNQFDVVVLVDVIHHLANPKFVLKEIERVLRPGGKLIVFEPNKLNPLLFFMHLLDQNEWGLLKLGRPAIYRRQLAPYVEIIDCTFNGLVIGPESPIFKTISDVLSLPRIYPCFGWLLPKIFLVGTKKI